MATLAVAPPLTAFDFLTRGYFHDRVIPALSSTGLGVATMDIVAHINPIVLHATNNRFRLQVSRNEPVQHSVPKRKHLRRTLTIPNPLPYAILSSEISNRWNELQVSASSPISLSYPVYSQNRAVEPLLPRSAEPDLRARASIGCRYLLKTDLVRFYPSIYTHSIPWAIHGKAAARNDPHNNLFGNRLDTCVRELQDKKTGGLPIGPDSSFILAEVISARIDASLAHRLGNIPLRGTRYIDDYHLYFTSRGDAEIAIAAIHGAAKEFELEINDTKTELCEIPEPLEPTWKTQLRHMEIEPTNSGRSVYALFDRAAEFIMLFPFDSIYTYVAKKLIDASITVQTWAICEPMLLRAALSEPSMLPILLELLSLHGVVNQQGLKDTLESICSYHARLQQGYEVAWALWLACTFGVLLSADVANAVAQVDDDIVALVALDLRSRGLLPIVPIPRWQASMNALGLYSNHWLLAYEAYEQGWLPSIDGTNYVANDAFFSILRTHQVRFYDPHGISGGGDYIYET